MGNYEPVGRAIDEMARFFLPYCRDQSTMRELAEMAADSPKWRYAHDLFDRIRGKTLRADDANDHLLQHQYSFEDICAKTLFNLSEFPAPFDGDSAFWVFPIAVSFARALGGAPLSVCAHLRH